MTKLSQRLTRSSDGYVAGVCAGLAGRLNLDPLWVRLAWLAAILFFGTGVALYLAVWVIVPREDAVPYDPPVRGGSGSVPVRRTENDRMIAGVCGGIARRYDMDPSVVRLIALSLATVSFGIIVIAYLAAALLIPEGSDAASSARDPVDL